MIRTQKDIDILYRRYVWRRRPYLCDGLGWEKTLIAEALMVSLCLQLIWHEFRNLIRPLVYRLNHHLT